MRYVPRILRAFQGQQRFYNAGFSNRITIDESYAQEALGLISPLSEPQKTLELANKALEANALTTATFLYTIPGLDVPIYALRTLISLLSLYHPQRTPSRLALLEALLKQKNLVLTGTEKSRLLMAALQYTSAETQRVITLRQAVQFVLQLPGDPPDTATLASIIEFACKNSEFAISRMCAETIMAAPSQSHEIPNCLAFALLLCSKRRTEHTFARRLFAYMKPSFDATNSSARIRSSLIWASININDKEASTGFIRSLLRNDRSQAQTLFGPAYVAANFFELEKLASKVKARLDELQIKFTDKETIALIKYTGQTSLHRAMELASLLSGSVASSAYLTLASIAAREHRATEFKSILQKLEASTHTNPFDLVRAMFNWIQKQEPTPGMHDAALKMYQETLWNMSPEEARSKINIRHRRSAIEMLASLYARDPDCQERSEVAGELIAQAVKVGLPPSRVHTLCKGAQS